MRVLNICHSDYANASHDNARALRFIGVECDDFVMSPHPFGYLSQSELINRHYLPYIVDSYDVVQIFHSCPVSLEYVLMGGPKKLVVYHTGSRYRNEPERFNNLFNPNVTVSFSDHCEFEKLGAKNYKYIAPFVDMSPVKKADSKLIVGHFPSNPEVKGTKEIKQMIKPFEPFFEFRISEEQIPHEQNIKRIAECHIYIELFKSELNGKPYGHYGVTAFEATSLGCKVITQNLNNHVYEKEYGPTPFLLANTPEDFARILDDIKYWHRTAFEPNKEFYERHSIESTGKRILDAIS